MSDFRAAIARIEAAADSPALVLQLQAPGGYNRAAMLLRKPLCAPLPALLAFLLGAAVPRADAQTQPIPELPRPEPTEPSGQTVPGASTTSTPGRPASWDYSFAAGLGWESNVGLSVGQGPSDYGGVLRGSLSRIVTKPRGTARFTAGGLGYLYKEQTQYNRADGDFAFDGLRRLSEKTTGILGFGFYYGHSDNSQILAEQGVLPPLTRTVAYTGSAGLIVQVSGQTSLSATLRAYRLDFPDAETLQSSSSLRASLGLDRRLNQQNTVGIGYSAERVDQPGLPTESPVGAYWTHYGSGQWTHVFSPRMATRLEAGASYTPDGQAVGLGRTWSFFGGASVNRQVKRSTLTAYYRREVIPVFGVGGLRLADRLGLDSVIPFARIWAVSVGGNYVRDAAGSSGGAPQDSLDTYGSIGARVSSQLRLSAEGRYFRRSLSGGYVASDNYRVGLVLSLVPPAAGPVGSPRGRRAPEASRGR